MLTPYHRKDRESSDRPWISEHREKELRAALRELPELSALVHTAIPGERLDTGGARHIPESRPPLNLDALNLTRRTNIEPDPIAAADETRTIGRRAAILDCLTSWVRLAEGEMFDEGKREPRPLNEPPTIEGECAWLSGAIVWILDQQWVREMADDLVGLAGECRALLRIRAPFRPSCPDCGRKMHDEGVRFRCGCGRVDSSTRMGLRSVVAQQHPMTPAELQDAFGIPTGTIRRWAHEGRLEPAVDEKGEPIRAGKALKYHIIDVLRLRDSGVASA